MYRPCAEVLRNCTSETEKEGALDDVGKPVKFKGHLTDKSNKSFECLLWGCYSQQYW